MPLEMLKVDSVDILKKVKVRFVMKVWSLSCTLLFLLLSAHTGMLKPQISAILFLLRASEIQSVAIAVRSWLQEGATTFSLIENRKIQLNAISPRCQTNTGDLEISTSFECLMCAVKLMCCACLIWLDIPPASSIALFFSETKWQFKRWILSLLHSKSLFTRSPAHLEARCQQIQAEAATSRGQGCSFNNCPLRYIDDDVWLQQLHLVLQSLIVCSSCCKYLIVGCSKRLSSKTTWH